MKWIYLSIWKLFVDLSVPDKCLPIYHSDDFVDKDKNTCFLAELSSTLTPPPYGFFGGKHVLDLEGTTSPFTKKIRQTDFDQLPIKEG